jgi:Flp pilus assembly protein TadD
MIRHILPLALLLATPLAAQSLSSAGDPADRLAGYLRTLAVSPRDVEALTGAGRAALEVGDANAAIGFYARADGLSGRDGRIKAGLATALLRMGKAREASRLFDQAVNLGVAESDIAGERGLSYDLRGDQRKAQRDYAIALAARPDAEITRRQALSMAISGDRAGAIQLLTPLLYKNDPAAWRARAFVLAMTGDPVGAQAIAASVMSAPQAQAMQPFLTRLAALNSEQKARAVTFGEMPSDGTRYSAAELAGFGAGGSRSTYRPETTTSAPAVASVAPAVSKPSSAWLRRREQLLKSYSPQASAEALKAEAPRSVPVINPPKPTLPVRASVAGSAGRLVPDMEALPVDLALNVAPKTRGRAERVETAKPEPKTKADAKTKAEAKAKVDPAKARAEAKKKAAEAKEKAEAAAEAKAAKASPERIWVQVAGGANKADLPKAWATVRSKSGALLKGRSASTTKLRATNRVMVGPFKSESEAQALVNKLTGAGMSGFLVTTEKGQKVEKLGS